MSDRFFAAVFAGVIATMIAMDLGLPFWRHLPIGDGFDFGVSTFFLVWSLLGFAKSGRR